MSLQTKLSTLNFDSLLRHSIGASNLDILVLEHTYIYFRIYAFINRLTEAESMVIRFIRHLLPRSSRLRYPRRPLASHHRMPVPYLWWFWVWRHCRLQMPWARSRRRPLAAHQPATSSSRLPASRAGGGPWSTRTSKTNRTWTSWSLCWSPAGRRRGRWRAQGQGVPLALAPRSRGRRCCRPGHGARADPAGGASRTPHSIWTLCTATCGGGWNGPKSPKMARWSRSRALGRSMARADTPSRALTCWSRPSSRCIRSWQSNREPRWLRRCAPCQSSAWSQLCCIGERGIWSCDYGMICRSSAPCHTAVYILKINKSGLRSCVWQKQHLIFRMICVPGRSEARGARCRWGSPRRPSPFVLPPS